MAREQADTCRTDVGEVFKVMDKSTHGEFFYDLAQAHEELVKAIRETTGKGRITLDLKFEPMKGDPAKLLSSYEIKVKKPRRPSKETIFFTKDDNTLSRKDPMADFADMDESFRDEIHSGKNNPGI